MDLVSICDMEPGTIFKFFANDKIWVKQHNNVAQLHPDSSTRGFFLVGRNYTLRRDEVFQIISLPTQKMKEIEWI